MYIVTHLKCLMFLPNINQMWIFLYIHTVVLIQYIYLLEISVKHNNYCRSYSLYIRTICFGLNRPSSGPQELNYVLCNIFVNTGWDPIYIVYLLNNVNGIPSRN